MTDKIIIKLKGGLGNQIFQFAAAYGATKATGAKLLLDVSYYDLDSRHGGCLIQHIFPLPPQSFIKITGIPESFIYLYTDGNPSDFIPHIYQKTSNIVLSGYFQNWKYIENVLSDLKNLYNLKINEYSGKNFTASLEKIKFNKDKLKIGVHIRRGDYTNKSISHIHGLINFDTIINTANKYIEEINQITILEKWIFTDDKNLIAPKGWLIFPTFANKVAGDILTFIAMSQCDYIVCSNSTYSYTASLLGRSKITMLPSQWMKNNQIKTNDLIGSNMIIYDANCE